MGVTVQPSILTVCVPGTAADLGALEFRELLVARKRAAAASVERALANDACDDSSATQAVANDVCESSTGSRRLGDSGLVNCDRMFLGDTEAGDEIGAETGAESLDASDDSAPDSAFDSVSCKPSFFHADSGKKALELMRMLRFDLLVTGDRLPDMPVGHLIRRVRVAWPWQKWAMVGSAISTPDEIAARSLGALAVFDAPADWRLLSSLAATAAGRASAVSNVGPKFAVCETQHIGSAQTDSGAIDSVETASPPHAALEVRATVTRMQGMAVNRISRASSKLIAGKRSPGKNANSPRASVGRRRVSDRSVV